jgi:hypothetical protein
MVSVLKLKCIQIVTEESACLSGKPHPSLNADHSEMCKYEDSDGENYKKVMGVLGVWARECASPKDKNEKEAARKVLLLLFSIGIPSPELIW